jgi:hypothetical protein
MRRVKPHDGEEGLSRIAFRLEKPNRPLHALPIVERLGRIGHSDQRNVRAFPPEILVEAHPQPVFAAGFVSVIGARISRACGSVYCSAGAAAG